MDSSLALPQIMGDTNRLLRIHFYPSRGNPTSRKKHFSSLVIPITSQQSSCSHPIPLFYFILFYFLGFLRNAFLYLIYIVLPSPLYSFRNLGAFLISV